MASQGDEQIVPELPLNRYPANFWTEQTHSILIAQVPPGTTEWMSLEHKVKESMNDVRIVGITRIQNCWLWDMYCFNKDRLALKNKGVINEKELFHGTRTTNPLEICLSEEGFDTRHSRNGSWGYANYFAESAQYSNQFSYTSVTGNKQIILARVTLGKTFDYGTERSPNLRMPPKLPVPGPLSFQNQRYDSVGGKTRGTNVFMTYDNMKAYPAYIIEYL